MHDLKMCCSIIDYLCTLNELIGKITESINLTSVCFEKDFDLIEQEAAPNSLLERGIIEHITGLFLSFYAKPTLLITHTKSIYKTTSLTLKVKFSKKLLNIITWVKNYNYIKIIKTK